MGRERDVSESFIVAFVCAEGDALVMYVDDVNVGKGG